MQTVPSRKTRPVQSVVTSVSQRGFFSVKTAVCLLAVCALIASPLLSSSVIAGTADNTPVSLNVLWPTNDLHLTGVQIFTLQMTSLPTDSYRATWKVDNGGENDLQTAGTVKAANVDVTNWKWKGNGPYLLTFTVRDSQNALIASKDVSIYSDGSPSTVYVPGTAVSSVSSAAILVASVAPVNTVPIEVWWPTDNTTVKGVQAVKALVREIADVEHYTMTWSAKNRQPTVMPSNANGFPHKEANINFADWPNGKQIITLVVTNEQKQTIATRDIPVTVENGVSSTSLASSSSAVSLSSSSATPSVASSSSVSSAARTVTDFKVLYPLDQTQVPNQFFMRVNTGLPFNDYTATWSVDGGSPNAITEKGPDGMTRQQLIDISGWNWRTDNRYIFEFVARDAKGITIGKKTVTVTKGGAAAQLVQATPSPQPRTSNGGGSLAGSNLYVNNNSDARHTADSWRQSRPSDAALMDKVANSSTAKWLGNWSADVGNDVRNEMKVARDQGALATFVVYNIPNRDCGSYSAGGAGSSDAYKKWIDTISGALGSEKAIIIVEPDALAQWDCANKNERAGLLSYAVAAFKNQYTYLDAAHGAWIAAADMAGRLKQSGVDNATGFAVNVSNFRTNDENIAFAEAISGATGGKHAVIDTARNGNGPAANNEWCNPSGRALGQKPTTTTGRSIVDAFLWLKRPGESDGNCNGGPNAGNWWADYALGLAQRAGW
ncbi:MAG: Glucanase [Candidatus Peribacteria bacterium]|nr:Glucanase [Candidatus Peribacteria bacterium]